MTNRTDYGPELRSAGWASMSPELDESATLAGIRIGSLFSGYGGLDEGVIAALGEGTVAWHVEFADAPAKVLAYHYPDVPNHVDVTTVDWATVEPVDVLTGGFPCQDVSLAGARRGLREGTRSGLWAHFAKAIDVLRPGLVVIENVRGLLSAVAGDKEEYTDEEVSDLESAQGVMGGLERDGRPVLRALGAVLGNLAELGYDAEWCGIRAADAGAPHGRFRVFILARPHVRYAGHDAGHAQLGEQPEGAASRLGESGANTVAHPAHDNGGRSSGARTADRGARVAEPTQSADIEGGRTPARDTTDGGRGHAQHPLRGDGSPQPIGGSDQPTTPDTDGQRRGEGRAEPEGRVGRLAPVLSGSPDADADGSGVETLSGRSGARDTGRLQPVGRVDTAASGAGRRAPAADTSGGGLERGTERDGEPQPRVEAPLRADVDGRTPADAAGARLTDAQDAQPGSVDEGTGAWGTESERGCSKRAAPAADADDPGRVEQRGAIPIRPQHPAPECGSSDAPADTRRERLREHAREPLAEEARADSSDQPADHRGLRPDTDWGPYRPAIERWETVTGRVAPSPTKPDGRDGNHRLSALFVEWMMGLELGHVTDPRIGLTRNEQLKALGNGVVPAQARLAVSVLLQRTGK